jgi:hypothetical protein
VDGAHAASCEEMSTALSKAEAAAYKGLQQCIETVMAEVDRLLSSEQKSTDYRSTDDGIASDHRPTNACIRLKASPFFFFSLISQKCLSVVILSRFLNHFTKYLLITSQHCAILLSDFFSCLGSWLIFPGYLSLLSLPWKVLISKPS